jgi:tetrahydromethanopterin S-methyltransferase subunit E
LPHTYARSLTLGTEARWVVAVVVVVAIAIGKNACTLLQAVYAIHSVLGRQATKHQLQSKNSRIDCMLKHVNQIISLGTIYYFNVVIVIHLYIFL